MLELNDFYSAAGVSPVALPDSTGVNVSADPNASASGNLFSGVGNFFGGLVTLFDNGLNIYKSQVGQWQAAQAITKQSAAPQTVVVTPSSLLSTANIIKIGAVVGIGVLALILIRKK